MICGPTKLTDRPHDVVEFLRGIMPLKRPAELYISLGYNKHGKSELYRDLLHHLGAQRSNKPSLTTPPNSTSEAFSGWLQELSRFSEFVNKLPLFCFRIDVCRCADVQMGREAANRRVPLAATGASGDNDAVGNGLPQSRSVTHLIPSEKVAYVAARESR